jgi:rhodanese-related sulfurtransferase
MSQPTAPRPTEIDPTTALERIAAGALLVDVREPDETAQASYDVANLELMPLSDFAATSHALPKDRELIMACRSGGRSARAMQFLLDSGYTHVVNLTGGIMRWQDEGQPMKGRL